MNTGKEWQGDRESQRLAIFAALMSAPVDAISKRSRVCIRAGQMRLFASPAELAEAGS